MRYSSFIVSVLLAGLLGFGLLRPAQAAPSTFSMNLLIFDDEFEDWQSWTTERIQAFLDNQSGVLKGYTTGGKTAAQIIDDAARLYHISAKVLLANIQKESSMITRSSFTSNEQKQYYLDWIMFYGWCDSCSTGSSKGFTNQINAATAAFRRYLNQIDNQGYTVSYWGPGISKSLQCISSDASRGLCTEGTTITIKPYNRATSALYTYTPHPGGNYSFWKIWRMFQFDLDRKYPDGTLIRAAGNSNVWLIQGGLKRRFTNSAAFLSRYSFASVITVPPDHLLLYKTGLEISYANYSLLGSPLGGVYLLVDDKKRPITTRAAFQNAGFRWEEVIPLTWAQLGKFPDGEDITTENIYPSGRLLQNNQTGAVFYVKDGKRYPIVCREIYNSQFGLRRPIPVTPTELNTFPESTRIGFKDGELVTAGSTAYIISQGKKRPIADPETFNAFRFSWGNLFSWSTKGGYPDGRVHQQCLDVHPLGSTLTIHQDMTT